MNSHVTHDSITSLAAIILKNRIALARLLDYYGYSWNKNSEKSFITTLTQALFNDLPFRQAADAIVITTYNKTGFIGAIIGAVTAVIGSAIGAISGRKSQGTAEDIAAQQAQAQIATAYLNLWGQQSIADASVVQGAYGLTTANTYKNVAIIGAISIGSILLLGAIFYFFYKVVLK